MTINAEVREIVSRGDWLRWRQNVMTGSRIGALFGVHPYMTMDDLTADLRGVTKGDLPSMRAGRIIEPGVLVALREDHPDWRIKPATTFHVDQKLRLGATPDAWLWKPPDIDENGLIQVKTVSPETWEEWRGKPPLAYTLQTLTEMLVTNCAYGLLAVMVRSRSYPLHEFEVPRHPAAEARILAAVAEWWRAWDAGETASPADAADLDAMLDDGSSIDLSADNEIRDLLERREASKEIAKASERQLAEIEAAIKAKIGAARTAWLPGWMLSWPTIHANEYTVAARGYRRLSIKRTDEA